jgi:2'-5' RNA ligase
MGTYEGWRDKGLSTYRIQQDNIISQHTLQNIREGKGITTKSIAALCKALGSTKTVNAACQRLTTRRFSAMLVVHLALYCLEQKAKAIVCHDNSVFYSSIESYRMRLFIAIDFSPEVKQSLAQLSCELERQADAGHAIPPENLHLTLVFIGETARLQEVIELMDAICHTELFEPLRLTLSRIGSFKNKRSHTWWVGVDAPPELKTLANALADGLREAGFSIERRAFKPHVTIGRGIITSRPVSLHLPAIELVADSVSLMRSTHKNGRPVYSKLHNCGISF